MSIHPGYLFLNKTVIDPYNQKSDSSLSLYYKTDNKGLLHSVTKPAFIAYEGQKVLEFYFYHGMLWRNKDLPSACYRYQWAEMYEYHKKELKDFSMLMSESVLKDFISQWGGAILPSSLFANTILSRSSGPASYTYEIKNDKKNLLKLIYYQNGKIHRDDGPAFICFNDQNEITDQQWHIEGKKL